jgi:hypothetical protein
VQTGKSMVTNDDSPVASAMISNASRSVKKVFGSSAITFDRAAELNRLPYPQPIETLESTFDFLPLR